MRNVSVVEGRWGGEGIVQFAVNTTTVYLKSLVAVSTVIKLYLFIVFTDNKFVVWRPFTM